MTGLCIWQGAQMNHGIVLFLLRVSSLLCLKPSLFWPTKWIMEWKVSLHRNTEVWLTLMHSSGSLSAQQEQKTQSFTVVSIQKNIEPWRDKRILRLYRIWPLIPKSYVVSERNRNLLISECGSSQICSLLHGVPCACVTLSVFANAKKENSGKWKDKKATLT